MCVVSPDVGRAKAAKKFQGQLGCDIAIMHKDRPKHNQAEITALIGDVTGKVCILNDDTIDTGGSLVAAAETLMSKGAKKVYACATHGLFSGPAYDRIQNSCIEEVVVTNAVPVPLDRQTGKIRVLGCSSSGAHHSERVQQRLCEQAVQQVARNIHAYYLRPGQSRRRIRAYAA